MADAARRRLEGAATVGGRAWPTSVGFSLLGLSEWAGRLPIALRGLLTAGLCLLLLWRMGERRAGIYSVVVLASTPLFLFNARPMLGAAPGFATSAAVALCTLELLFGNGSQAQATKRLAWTAGLLVSAALAAFISGALLGVFPPLAAGVTVALMQGRLSQPAQRPFLVGATLLCLALAALIAGDVVADEFGYSLWLGGKPQAGNPPTFDSVLEHVFHGFTPWSALLPLALAWMWRAPVVGADAAQADADRAQALRLTLLLWAALGYAAQTLYISRYGLAVTYLPVVALSASVALLMRDIEGGQLSPGPTAVASALLCGLVIRDFGLYPNAPVHGMPLTQFEVPEELDTKRIWSALLSAFGFFVAMALIVRGSEAKPALRAPYAFLRNQWRRGLAFKLWLVIAAALALGLLTLGLVAMVAGQQAGMTVQGIKWAQRLMLLPIALPMLVAGLQLLWFAYGRLAPYRWAPPLLTAAAIGVYAAHGYLPSLSAHFSPREVFETFLSLAGADEELAEYKVGGRAAAYYAEGRVTELKRSSEVIDYLSKDKRRWAVFPADELADLDRSFRRRTGRHLFVADARSARVILASNQEIPERDNESFLVKYIRKEAPSNIQHPVSANLDKRLEFLGYDLELPHGDYVGAGESFRVTWYFKVLSRVAGNYKIFVHIDGAGQRIHGDHEPLDGRYPVRLWDEGDYIIDQQELEVPGTYRGGTYTIYLGFYSGSTRLKVTSGPADNANRIRAGVLRVR